MSKLQINAGLELLAASPFPHNPKTELRSIPITTIIALADPDKMQALPQPVKDRMLIQSIHENNLETVNKLIDEIGADPHPVVQLDFGGHASPQSSVLHEAVKLEDPAILRAILHRGVEVNLRDNNGDTPVMLAASGRNFAAVRALVEAGADLTLRNCNDKRANPSEIVNDTESPLGSYLLAETAKQQQAKRLAINAELEQLSALPENEQVALIQAQNKAWKGRIPAEYSGFPALFTASFADIVVFADPDKVRALSQPVKDFMLVSCVTNNKAEAVVGLLSMGANASAEVPHISNRIALHEATALRDSTILRLLLDQPGIDINCRDSQRRTALMQAGIESNLVALNVLVAAGADVTLRDQGNYTAQDFGNQGCRNYMREVAFRQRLQAAAPVAMAVSAEPVVHATLVTAMMVVDAAPLAEPAETAHFAVAPPPAIERAVKGSHTAALQAGNNESHLIGDLAQAIDEVERRKTGVQAEKGKTLGILRAAVGPNERRITKDQAQTALCRSGVGAYEAGLKVNSAVALLNPQKRDSPSSSAGR